MQSRDLLKLSTRMFKARTTRTLLTILGMGIGIAAILFLVSFGYGLQRILLQTITTSDSLLSLTVMPDNSKGLMITREFTDSVKGLAGVVETSPLYEFKSKVKFEGLNSDSVAMVAAPSYLKLSGTKIAAGDGLDDGKPRDIVISTGFAKIFNREPEEMIGKELEISLEIPEITEVGEVEVMGAQLLELDSPVRISGYVQSDEPLFYANSVFVDPFVPDELPFSQLKVKCADNQALEEVKNEITKEGYQVTSLSERVHEINKLFNVINIILAFFGVIALAVSAIGMFNTMTVALLERMKEIGIMKAVGASSQDILLLFISESTIMGFFGGVAGVVIGILGGTVFNLIVNFIAGRMGGKPLELFYYPVWFLILIICFAVVVGFLTGLVPARRASSVELLDALHSK